MMSARGKWMYPVVSMMVVVVLAIQGISLTGCGQKDSSNSKPAASPATTQFVFTSDAHYGLSRGTFTMSSGATISGDAQSVNEAMIAEMNRLPASILPNDGGVNGGTAVGAIDFIIEGGNITTRMETVSHTQGVVVSGAEFEADTINGLTSKDRNAMKVPFYPVAPHLQSATTSWAQFETDYINGLTLKDRSGNKAPLYLVPGNHDVSNAIGYYKPMNPTTDATSMTQIYNRMMNQDTPRTALTYSYGTDNVFYSKNMGGVHFMFVGVWPDSKAREWMKSDLAAVSDTTPAILVAHDQPDVETKHLTNPNGSHDINAADKFENVIGDISSSLTITGPTTVEQGQLAAFLKDHKNIVAYFHGNDHMNGVYQYTGPLGDISLNTIRVDSPMKGIDSAADPTKLAFKVVSIDSDAKKMTVRDYFWTITSFGTSTTLSLAPRSK